MAAGPARPHRPAHQRDIARKPDHQRQQQPRIRPRQHDCRPHQGGRGKSNRVKGLKYRLARRRRRLHDAIGNPPREIAFKPADGLAQHMPMRAPAHHRAKVRQNGVVQQRHASAATKGRRISTASATRMISVPWLAQTCAGSPLASRSTIRPRYQISPTSNTEFSVETTAVIAKTLRNGEYSHAKTATACAAAYRFRHRGRRGRPDLQRT